MAKIGVNNEPLHERLMFGWDGTNYRVVKVDTSGNIVIVPLADQNIQSRSYGWINAAWQKNPIQRGYSDSIAERVQNTALPAGTTTLTSTAVPAGKVHVYYSIGSIAISATATMLRHYINVSGVGYNFFRQPTPVSGTLYDKQGEFIVGPGDYLQCAIDGATLNDQLYFDLIGYRFDIDQ